MADPLEALQKLLTCPFCANKFRGVVKLVPDCGNSICGQCYQDLKERPDDSREYKCPACDGHHVLPDHEFQDNRQLLGLLGLQIEKPLPPEAKKLQLLIERVQDELARLQGFDAKEFINQHCDELRVQVADAAESAVKHIWEIEKGLLDRIEDYRRQSLKGVASQASESSAQEQQLQSSIDRTQRELDVLSQEIESFGKDWKDYFSKLSVLKTELNVSDALAQADIYQASLKELDLKLRARALNGASMLFSAQVSFHAKRDHVGELVEMATRISREVQEITIRETPSNTMTGHSDWICQVVFLPDGRLASCSRDKRVKIWDTESGQELFTLQGHADKVYTIALLSNGWLASGSVDQTIKLWDLQERREVRTLREHSGGILDLKVLENGLLVSCSADDSIKIWNPFLTENNLISTLVGHGNMKWLVPMAVLSNDFLFTCSRDIVDFKECTLRLWNYNAGKLVNSLPTGLRRVRTVLVLSNGLLAMGTEDGAIKIEDDMSRVKQKAHDYSVFRLLQLLSNDNLVSAGRDNHSSGEIHTIKVWNVKDLSLLQQVNTGHSGIIYSLSISQDESLLATGSEDKTIKLWPITHRS